MPQLSKMEILLCALINFSCSLHTLAGGRIYLSFPFMKSQQFSVVRQMDRATRVSSELICCVLGCAASLIKLNSIIIALALINIQHRVSLIYGEKKCCNLIRLIFTTNCIHCLKNCNEKCEFRFGRRAGCFQSSETWSLWIIF